jgi:serine/threonine-protein kinase
MEPPIASGTILQNRYHLISVLGQGGFGRTYLAEDQGRFNELCALKELIPPQIGAFALEKSKELFQREASTLYQINHPQIPQFRANFEQDGRLFLVQDYVDGKTYRDLLKERKDQTFIQNTNPNLGSPALNRGAAANGVFSEAEVRQLLLQLLPVLDHIHSKGIIHRDITPDNIIRRNTDGLPVLIDFGVVKELATRFHTPNSSAPVTTVGKVGYAPSEQIQTGRAYPSSDLYSLAATAVVLLAGKEPQALYDDKRLSWNWRQGVNVSDEFAQVLNRMLNYRPNDRYQTATEVMQALDSGISTAPPTAAPPPPASQTPDPNVSRAATVAVGRRPEPDGYGSRSANRPNHVIPEPTSRSVWENPLAVVGVGTALALLTGLASYGIFSAINKRQDPQVPVTPTDIPTETLSPTDTETPTPTPTPTPTASPTPTPTPTLTPTPSPTQPVSFSRRLNLTPGRTLTESGNLKANTTINYIIQGQQDQQLTANIPGEGVLMTVLGPNQRPVNNQARRVQQWQGTLPFNGNYTIQVSPVQGLPDSDYRLVLSLANSQPSPSPTTPTTPSYAPPEQLDLPTDKPTDEILRSGTTSPQLIKRYVVNVKQGQQMTPDVSEGVTLNVTYPDGRVAQNVKGTTFTDGRYTIDAIAQKETDFTLSIVVKNAGNPQ